MLAKFWYVRGDGKKRSFSQCESKVLSGKADLKTKKMLHDAGVFLEGLGPAAELAGSGIQVENAVYADMCSQWEKFRYAEHALTEKR